MRLALMQPYFFPYIGYFSIVRQVDRYIVLDTVQYIEHGWMDRNRILKSDQGWQYIHLPTLKHSSTAGIREVRINNNQKWKAKILGQLQHYKKKAPYYQQTIDLLQNLFEDDYTTVCDFNVALLKEVCAYLRINTPIELLSEGKIHYEKPQQADEWGLNVCKAIPGVTEYWNAPGGKSFFHEEKYQKAGVKLCFQKMDLQEYPQKGNPFEPGLSILDVMMFNSVEEIQNMMDAYTLI